MALRRSHSSEYSSNMRLSRRDNDPKVTAHPGFLAVSPRSSSAHTSEESRRSESSPEGSGFIHNMMAPMSSHLLSSGMSGSPTSKGYSKTSSRSTPSAEKYKFPREALHQKRKESQYHYTCTHSTEPSCSKMRSGTPTKRIPSKPPTPTSRPSSQAESNSQLNSSFQGSRPSSQTDLPQSTEYQGILAADMPQTVGYHGSRPSSRTESVTPETADYQGSRPSSQWNKYTEQTIYYQMNVLKEKYAKLKEDYNAKMEEVSAARVELESAIKEAVDRHRRCEVAEQKAADLILRIKEAEFEKIKCSSSNDRILEMENQLSTARQKHSESLEDVDEAKKILQQQLEAVVNMRKLYLETEQLAEEQNRKLGTLESENERLSEQIALSVDQAREQFHLQVFELGPLADSVSKLNESIMINKEKKYRADKKAESLKSEIAHLTSRNEELKAKLAEMRGRKSMMDKEKSELRVTIDSKQEERAEAKAENYSLRAKIKDLEELNSEKETKISMRSGEVNDLSARLETLREECARQISSNKNVLMNARKAHLKRLTALEKDLAKTKADESAAEKERDEIRQRLEDQIASLSMNLSQAQEKIRNLQDSLGYINRDRNVRVRRISNPHAQI